MQGAQYKLLGKMGMILEQAESKLGHKPEATDFTGEAVVTEKAEIAAEEE